MREKETMTEPKEIKSFEEHKKIDVKRLEEYIDNIPICEKGKEAIKKLFENTFGVAFNIEPEFVVGGIYGSGQLGDYVILIADYDNSYSLLNFDRFVHIFSDRARMSKEEAKKSISKRKLLFRSAYELLYNEMRRELEGVGYLVAERTIE